MLFLKRKQLYNINVAKVQKILIIRGKVSKISGYPRKIRHLRKMEVIYSIAMR